MSRVRAVLRRGDDVAIDAAHIHCDAVALEAACAAGCGEEALALYTGDLLAGFAPGGSAELDQWLDAAVPLQGLGVWELTRPILVQSCELPQPFHGDPADQILVATARHHGAVLVTKDQRIRRYAHVQSLW